MSERLHDCYRIVNELYNQGALCQSLLCPRRCLSTACCKQLQLRSLMMFVRTHHHVQQRKLLAAAAARLQHGVAMSV